MKILDVSELVINSALDTKLKDLKKVPWSLHISYY